MLHVERELRVVFVPPSLVVPVGLAGGAPGGGGGPGGGEQGHLHINRMHLQPRGVLGGLPDRVQGLLEIKDTHRPRVLR